MSIWMKLFTTLHIWVFQASNGRIGNKLGKQSILLIKTIGRKTGKSYATTLSYYMDSSNYLLVASNWGKQSQPGWFYNLLHQSRAVILVDDKMISVDARQAEGDEYQRLWRLVTSKNEQYVRYQKVINRRIPIIVLIPANH